MAVIALLNQKGGVGKSTTAVHLAAYLAEQGEAIALIDSDAQKSSSTWLKLAELPIPYHVIAHPDELLESIPEIAAKYDHLIIDAPAGISESIRAILLRADLCVIPCQPTGVDLHSSTDSIRLVRQAQSVRGGIPRAIAFISRAVPRTRLKTEAISLLGKIPEITLLKAVVHQRQAIADTFSQHATIWGVEGSGAIAAAEEYENLIEEIMTYAP